MKHYETIFIISPVISGEETKKLISKFKDLLKKQKAELVHEEDWGNRELAYLIKGKQNGYYYLLEYKSEAETVNKLETEFIREENILRFLTVSLDKHALAFNDRRKKGTLKKSKKDTINKEKELETVK